ncbi:MAG: hypothetical protein R3F20_04015 [Planctomycetota bacterium]
MPLSVQVAHPRQHEITRGEFELRGADFTRAAERSEHAHPMSGSWRPTACRSTSWLLAGLPLHAGRDDRGSPGTRSHGGPDAQPVAWVFGRGGWRQAPDRETIRGRTSRSPWPRAASST